MGVSVQTAEIVLAKLRQYLSRPGTLACIQHAVRLHYWIADGSSMSKPGGTCSISKAGRLPRAITGPGPFFDRLAFFATVVFRGVAYPFVFEP